MPTYVYCILRNGRPTDETFEVVQKMTDPPLQQHPETGEPVQRVLTPPRIGSGWSEGAMNRNVANDKKLERLGFTKYVKSGGGTWEKRTGKGPDVISKHE